MGIFGKDKEENQNINEQNEKQKINPVGLVPMLSVTMEEFSKSVNEFLEFRGNSAEVHRRTENNSVIAD